MRIALTGAHGFIGRAFQRQAPEHTLIFGKSSDPQFEPFQWLKDAQADVLLHLGWYARPGLYLNAPENQDCLAQSIQLWQAAAQLGVHAIGVGSGLEYGDTSERRVEGLPCTPLSPYAKAKHEAYLRGIDIAGEHFAWARIFHLYGPDEAPGRLLPTLINGLERPEGLDFSVVDIQRDWLHVDDVADALKVLAEQRARGCYNICSGDSTSLEGFIRTLAGIMDAPVRLKERPRQPHEDPILIGDSQRLRSLGWKPRYTLASGFQQILSSRSPHAPSPAFPPKPT